MSTTTMDLTTRDVQLGEHCLHVHEVGDPANPTILWLHGSGPGVSALSNWERLITSMPDYHHIAPDVLGFGQSSHPDPAPHGLRAYTKLRAEVLLQLIAELNLGRVHVVGNSMGGMITLQMALTEPDCFDRIVLMGSGGSPVPPTADLIKMIMFYEDPSEAAMADLMESFVYDTAMFGDQLDQIAANRVAVATRPEVRRSHLATFNMTPPGGPLSFTPEQLATIENQVLVVHGREDRMIPVDAAVYMMTNLPNAQLHVLPHAGHWVQIEQVNRFRIQAQAFFGEVS